MNKLLEMLPSYEKKTSDVYREILNAEQIEFDMLNINIEDLQKQMFIDTATWGLSIYEKELGIKTNLNKPLDERRSVVKSKWRGTGKVDSLLIKAVADAFTNGDVKVEFDGNIIINFNSVLGTPPNLPDVKNAIGEINPAHLAIIYKFAHLLIKDIHDVMTLEQFENITLDKFAFLGGIE